MDKPTLLEIVQDCLNDISGDEVTSFEDTVESMQVAAIVRSAWFDMATSRNWSFMKTLCQPLADSTAAAPTTVQLSPNLKEMIFLNYIVYRNTGDTDPDYRELKYLHPDQFLFYCNQRNLDADNVQIVTDPSGVKIKLLTDQGPTYYSSFDDEHIILDSYNYKDLAEYTKANKFQIYAYMIPDWTHSDDFVPPLPLEAFPQLIEESKSRCAVKLRQQPDQKSEQESTRQRRFLARKQWSIAGGIRFPNYGRAPRRLQERVVQDVTFRRPPY